MGKGSDPFSFHDFPGTGFGDVTGIVKKLRLVGKKGFAYIGVDFRQPIAFRDGFRFTPPVALNRQHSFLVDQADDRQVEFELADQQPEKVIHDDLEIGCPAHDLRCAQPHV